MLKAGDEGEDPQGATGGGRGDAGAGGADESEDEFEGGSDGDSMEVEG